MKNNQKNVIIKGNNSFDRMGVSIRIRFVALRHPENTYTIPPQILATATSDPLGKSANIIYQGSIIIPSTPTCKVSKSSYNIMMNSISASQLPTIGSKAVGGTTNIEMTCESARVDVYATMTDANDPSATKELLSLEQGSTAKGVVIKLYRNDEVIKLAPASHVYNQSNDQWLFGNKKKGLISVPITAHYYRTEEVTTGKVLALAFINFAYQ